MPKRMIKTSKGRRFTVVLEKEDIGGYSVRCVEIPEAISQGETREEALSNIKEAIELVLDSLEEKAKQHKGKKVEFAEVVEEHFQEHPELFAGEEMARIAVEADKMSDAEFDRLAGEILRRHRKTAAELVSEERDRSS